MTIGQRIAALRKERHFSQEELGAQLGVSRQSIYKWESDASLPEIDKLVALSKLFGVSVGWLLGVEEERAAEAEEPQAQSEELTETQLKMVEEIVGRYIAAQPKPQKPVKKKWPYVVSAVVVAALLLTMNGLNGKLNRLNNQYNNLQSSIDRVQSNVNGQIGGISNRVEEILKSQNNLTADYSTSLSGRDLAANTVTFHVEAIPKTYVEGMTAVFRATEQESGKIVESTGVLGENQQFSAELTCPLSDTIILSVTFADGEKQETQMLEQYYDLYTETVPDVSVEDYSLMFMDAPSGKVTLNNTYFTTRNDAETVAVDEDNPPAEIQSIRVGLFKDQTLVAWAEPCAQPASFKGDYGGEVHFYRLPDLTLTLAPNEILAVAAVVTDTYGRETLSVGAYYEWSKDDEELVWADRDFMQYGPSTEGWTY